MKIAGHYIVSYTPSSSTGVPDTGRGMGRGSRREGSDGLSHMFSWLPELVSCFEGLSISSYTASGSLLRSVTAPYASLSVVFMVVPSTDDGFLPST